MLSKDKKKKLRGVLAKMNPDKKGELLIGELKEELEEVTKKIPKDNSPEVQSLQTDLEELKSNLLSKIDKLTTKQSLEDLKKQYLSSLSTLEEKLKLLILSAESDIAGNKEYLINLDKELKELKLRTLALGSHGGGNMNRQIKVNGIDVLKRYTDINWVAGSNTTLTAVVDDVNKRENITITTTGGGGTPGGNQYDVQFNDPFGSFNGSDNFTYSPTNGLTVGDGTKFDTSVFGGVGMIVATSTSGNAGVIINVDDNFDYNAFLNYSISGTNTWKVGIPEFNNSNYVIQNVGTGQNAISVDNGTNVISTASGMSINDTFSSEPFTIFDYNGTPTFTVTTVGGIITTAYNTLDAGNGDATFAGTVTATDFYNSAGLLVSSQWITSGSNIYYNLGRVAVGNTSPQAPFHLTVSGSTFTPVGDEVSIIQRNGGGSDNAIASVIAGSSGIAQYRFGDTSNTGAGSLYKGSMSFYNSDSHFQFEIANTPYLYLVSSGRFGIQKSAPASKLHLGAGSATANTAPLQFDSGALETSPRVGVVEFLTDKIYQTITTGSARKEITLNDSALTSGIVPVATTNGRLKDNTSATTDTELGYVHNVTSAIQTQLNAKGSGTVTSVSGSGGTTGLTLTGGAITTSGTLTIGGTLAIANGGTGSSTALGIPIIVGNDRKTAQTAAVSLATFTVPASDTSYQISANVNVTAFAVGTFNVQVAYTDETNTAQTLKLNFSSVTGTIGLAIAATGPFEGIEAHIRCKASTTIIVSSTGTFTSLTYNMEERIVQL